MADLKSFPHITWDDALVNNNFLHMIHAYDEANNLPFYERIRTKFEAWRNPEKCWKTVSVDPVLALSKNEKGEYLYSKLMPGGVFSWDVAKDVWELPGDAQLVYKVFLFSASLVFIVAHPAWPNVNDLLVERGTVANHELAFNILESVPLRENPQW